MGSRSLQCVGCLTHLGAAIYSKGQSPLEKIGRAFFLRFCYGEILLLYPLSYGIHKKLLRNSKRSDDRIISNYKKRLFEMCQYKFINGEFCKKETYDNSGFCVLHVSFPKDESSQEFRSLADLKDKVIMEEISQRGFEFEGLKLYNMELEGTFDKAIHIKNSLIYKDVTVRNANIPILWLYNVTICGSFIIDKSELSILDLSSAHVNNYRIDDLKVKVFTIGEKTKIKVLLASNSKFGSLYSYEAVLGKAIFSDIMVEGDITLYDSNITDGIRFNRLKIEGGIRFPRTVFSSMENQEYCCRLAKVALDKVGDRNGADNHYFREMEASRKQKIPIKKFSEWLLIQLPFGYGTKPLRVIFAWIIVVLGWIPLYYWHSGDVKNVKSYWDALYFSIVTATTLGYGDCLPLSSWAKAVVSFEAIFGTFMWAALITVFARKFMR
jgi:hypothetical protein